jgi:hypothetical protein
MADLILGLIAFLVVLSGLVMIMIVAVGKRRRDAIARRNEPQVMQKRLRDLNALIDRINQATTDDELDSLERRKGE